MFKCTICSNKLTKFTVIDGYVLLSCKHCGMLTTNAHKNEIDKYVAKKYSKQYAIDYNYMAAKLNKRFNDHLNLVDEFNIRGKLLDIGCGTGHFLKYLLVRRFNLDLYGVEPNGLLRKVASSNTGLQIESGFLSKIPYKNTYFNIITCYDVLEHNVDLRKNVQELKRVLKPGGAILVQAPNYKSFMAYITGKKWDWWCVPDHVLHFSYDFLTNYFETNGFRILKSYTYEDQEDFLSNIKGMFLQNYLTKALFIFLIPLLILIERIGWMTNHGGLTVVLAQKK